MKFLGKLLFPKLQPHEQRNKVQVLIVSIVVGLLLSAAFIVVALLANGRRIGV